MLQVVWRKLTKSLPLNRINVQQLEPIFSELTHFTMKYNRISQNLFMFHLPLQMAAKYTDEAAVQHKAGQPMQPFRLDV